MIKINKMMHFFNNYICHLCLTAAFKELGYFSLGKLSSNFMNYTYFDIDKKILDLTNCKPHLACLSSLGIRTS